MRVRNQGGKSGVLETQTPGPAEQSVIKRQLVPFSLPHRLTHQRSRRITPSPGTVLPPPLSLQTHLAYEATIAHNPVAARSVCRLSVVLPPLLLPHHKERREQSRGRSRERAGGKEHGGRHRQAESEVPSGSAATVPPPGRRGHHHAPSYLPSAAAANRELLHKHSPLLLQFNSTVNSVATHPLSPCIHSARDLQIFSSSSSSSARKKSTARGRA